MKKVAISWLSTFLNYKYTLKCKISKLSSNIFFYVSLLYFFLSISTITYLSIIPAQSQNSTEKQWESNESEWNFSSLQSSDPYQSERRTRVSWITSISSSTIIQSAFDRPKVINLSNDMALCFFSSFSSASSSSSVHCSLVDKTHRHVELCWLSTTWTIESSSLSKSQDCGLTKELN